MKIKLSYVWLVVAGIAVLLAGISIALTPMGRPGSVEAHQSSVHDLTLSCPTSVIEGETYKVTLTMDDAIIVRGVEGSWHWRAIPGQQNTATMISTAATDEEKATADLIYWEGGLNEVTSPAEYFAKKIEHTFAIKEDDITEPSEWFRVYFKNHASGGHGAGRLDVLCNMYIVDDDPPTVKEVRMSNTPALDNTYRLGDYIYIDVEFDEPVYIIPDRVAATDEAESYVLYPKLQFWLDGDGDDTPKLREADFDETFSWETSTGDSEPTLVPSGGGLRGDVLRFEYKVKAGDSDADGLTIGAHTETGLGQNMIGWSSDISHYADHTFDAQEDLTEYKIDGRFHPVDLAVLEPADNPETNLTNDIWSSPANGQYYRPGEIIYVSYYFNDEFDVVGNPGDVSVDILMGYDGNGVDKDSTRRRARAYSRYGRQALARLDFKYTVRAEDMDADGIAVDANSLRGYENLRPRSNPEERAYPIHPGIAEDSGHKVLGSPRVTDASIVTTPANGSHYTYGEDIGVRLTYDANVTLRGTGPDPWLMINLGEGEDAPRRATFSDERSTFLQTIYALNTSTLLFTYRVQAGDFDSDGISVASNADGTALGGGRKIYEFLTRLEPLADSFEAVSNYPGIDETPAHQVDTTPFVKSVGVVSTPRHGDTYGMGETIKIQLTLDQPMTVGDGELSIPFVMSSPYSPGVDVSTQLGNENQVNPNLRQARYDSISSDGTKLVFHYDIQGNDADVDGISLDAVSDGRESVLGTGEVKVPGVEIAWDGTYESGGSDLTSHKVDSNPFATGVDVISTPANGDTYGVGENIDLKLTYNEPVEVLGSLFLTFQLGENSEGDGHLRQAQYHSGSDNKELVFRYTVAQGDVDENGIVLNVGGAGEHTATSGNAVQSKSQGQSWSLKYSARGDDLSAHKVSGSTAGTAPGAPTDFTAEGYSDTRIDLNWTAPTVTGGSEITGYRIEVSEDEGATWSVLVADTGDADNSYSHTGLERGDARHYRVHATNSVGTGLASGEVSGVADILWVEFQRTLESGGTTSDIRLRDSFVVRVGLKYPSPSVSYASVDGFEQEDIEVSGGTVSRFIRHNRIKGIVYLFINTDGGADRVTIKVGENVVDARNWPAQVYYGSPASIESIEVTSDPGSDDTYVGDDSIEVTVTFSEDVTVTGTPQLELDFNGTARAAGYSSTNGAAVIFSYAVAADDIDTDGIAIAGNKLSLNGGAIQDETANNAALTHDAVAADSGHKVRGSDTTVPSVSSVVITSNPGEDDTYVEDDSIEITVTFSEDVTVTGTPQLELDFDGTATTADYSSASGAAVVFSYAVAAADIDTDGIAIGTDKLSLNGGTIQGAVGNNAVLTHDAVAADSGHKVEGTDTTAPTVSSVAITSDPGDDDTYGLGDSIEVTVTFSEDVTVTGTPQLELDFDGTAKTADYSSASGAAVVFSYTVALDESDADGIAIGADKLSLNGGEIRGEVGNDATLAHTAVAADSGHKVDSVDAIAPTVSSLSFTSDPGEDRTYGTGDVVQVTVTFSEDMTVTGTPQLELTMSNTSARQAGYSSSNSSGANVVFEYTVVVGDRASDGLEIRANKLTLNGGAIQDASGNDATLTHPNYFVASNHFVNGTGGV